jgi:hypothetical protein
MSVIATMLAAAEAGAEHAEEHHKSEAPFFIAGGLWALFAVIVSVIGFTRPEFPSSAGAARGVMMASVVFMLGAASTAIYVAL